ncbi:MAG: LCP family protein [Marmoricola sp.]
MPEFKEPPRPESGDPELPQGSPTEEITVTPVGKRKRVKERKKRSLARKITYGVVGLVVLALIAYGGFYAYILWKAEHDIKQSNILAKVTKPSGKGMDLLLMGLDSRKDENGNPLPADVYNALHAGDAQSGGNNSNVLMYIHVPNDGSKATAISIPRDDWVDIANCKTDYNLRQMVPRGCMGKIKSAYGWQLAAVDNQCAAQGGTKKACWAKAKDAARLEEIQTVQQFLGVKISSFVEVTMGAFYEIAREVQPITVCVKESTTDQFSGANFKKGVQRVNARNAVAFVRQRRDLYDRYSFTDLDRSRRQQAFIVSLLTQMKSAGTLLNPLKLNSIVDVATNNVVTSKGLDALGVANLASNLSGGKIHFYTLPVVSTNYSPPGSGGESANEVNVAEVRAIVKNLVNPPKKKKKVKAKPLPSGAGYTVNAVNSSGVNHAAAKQLKALTKNSYKSGTATSGPAITSKSTISYNPADKTAAEVLAKRLGGSISLVANAKAKSHVFTLTIGTTLANKATSGGTPTSTVLPKVVSATGGGTNGPATNQLTDLSSGGIPCVK